MERNGTKRSGGTKELIVMDHPQYQPVGVAVFSAVDEIADELLSQGVTEFDLEEVEGDYLSKCRVERFCGAMVPENGVFPTRDEYLAARVMA